MNKTQAEAKGYGFSGVYNRDKAEVKERIIEEREKGNKALLVTIPHNKLSRGHGGPGYSMYVLKSEANIKKARISNAEKLIKIHHSNIDQVKQALSQLESLLKDEEEALNELLN